MTEPEEKLGSDVHPAATLLPWYLNGTLREEERQEVAQHLRECQPCRTELDELSRLRQQVKAAYADLPGVSPQVFRSVMATIRSASSCVCSEASHAVRTNASLTATFE